MPELACSADTSNGAVATELHVLVAKAAHTPAKVMKRWSPCHLKRLAKRHDGKDSCPFYSAIQASDMCHAHLSIRTPPVLCTTQAKLFH